MRIKYIDKKFQGATLDLIELANRIISEYQAAGFQLTLRQLYYQLVARGHMANKQREYKRLGSIIADARLAGMVSWEAIEDRTRNVRGNQHWDSPEQIVREAINSYRIDRWASQPYRPEVWIEKDALVGVIAGVCQQMDVDYFSCRGYVSASEMWQAGHVRFRRYLRNKQTPVIIHLGDHDPSGIDMTRDIQERLTFLLDVGLDYLSLDRPSGSLSGGEAQRIRLATQIGAGLVGVLYVLDELSIGLHQRDNQRLIETLIRLRDLGGIIVLDYIDMMRSSARRNVERATRDALKRDRARSKIGRISQFGLLELTRQRLGPGLSKLVYENCSRCRGSGRQRNASSRAQAILLRLGAALTLKGFTSVEVRAHPEVIEYLKGHLGKEMERLEQESGRSLVLMAVPDQVEDSVLHYLRADGREVRPGGRRKR